MPRTYFQGMYDPFFRADYITRLLESMRSIEPEVGDTRGGFPEYSHRERYTKVLGSRRIADD